MRVALVYNTASAVISGSEADLASDQEMKLIPELIADELTRRGHAVCCIPADWDVGRACRAARVDIVLNLAEGFAGTNGHEHLVPSLLDFAKIPYTGADAANMLILRDKAFTKEVLRTYGVKMPAHQLFTSPTERRDQSLVFPLIVKPVHEEASIGIRFSSVVTNDADLKRQLAKLLDDYRQPILAEEFVTGRELSVGVCGNGSLETLPLCEFSFVDTDPLRQFRSFEYKWLGAQETMSEPQDLSIPVRETLKATAKLCHATFRCRDYSRADFRLSLRDEVYFLEHNFNPGIGPNSHGLSNTFTKMAEFAGIPFGDMLEKLIAIAIRRYPSE